MEAYGWIPGFHDGPTMAQIAGACAPLTGERIAGRLDDVPSMEYIKEERSPTPGLSLGSPDLVGGRVECIHGGGARPVAGAPARSPED